ncbi:MAG: glycosyltransferase [bacterium]
MKILFLTSRLPFPPVGGDKLRTFNFLKYIKKKHNLTIISFIDSEKDLEYIFEYRQYYDKLITITLPKLQSYKNCLNGLFSPTPLQVHYYFSKKMKETVNKELKNGYDTIFCHLIRMAQYLPADNNIYKVIDLTDAISLNYIRSKKFRRGIFSIINLIESKRVLNYEITAIDKSDKSILISNIDRNFLLNNQNSDKIKIVANGVDLNIFKFHQGYYDENQISFIGNMRTFPNTDAVLYFVDAIFPKLKKVKPKLKFFIVGNEPSKEVLRIHDGKNILVTGYVDSVTSYIKNSVVTVAPMRVGAGIQNKILEAMAVGTPVVTTTIGAEGLDENKLTIGNTPEEIYLKTLSLIENKKLRQKKSLIGREYIEKNFSWEIKLKNLDQYLTNSHQSECGKIQ